MVAQPAVDASATANDSWWKLYSDPVLDRLEPYSLDALDAAGRELIAALRATSPGVRIETELLGNHS